MISQTPGQIEIRYLRRYAVVCAAGPIGWKMSEQADDPNWKRFLDPSERLAWHEAGHCIAQLLLGMRVQRLIVHIHGETLCGISSTSDKSYSPEDIHQHKTDAQNGAIALIRLKTLGQDADPRKVIKQAQRLLRRHRRRIAALAFALHKKGELSAAEISHVTGLPQPPVEDEEQEAAACSTD